MDLVKNSVLNAIDCLENGMAFSHQDYIKTMNELIFELNTRVTNAMITHDEEMFDARELARDLRRSYKNVP